MLKAFFDSVLFMIVDLAMETVDGCVGTFSSRQVTRQTVSDKLNDCLLHMFNYYQVFKISLDCIQHNATRYNTEAYHTAPYA